MNIILEVAFRASISRYRLICLLHDAQALFRECFHTPFFIIPESLIQLSDLILYGKLVLRWPKDSVQNKSISVLTNTFEGFFIINL